MVCDETAADAMQVSRIAYSKYLVAISEMVVCHGSRLASSSGFSRSRSSVRNRIRYLLNRQQTFDLRWGLGNKLALVMLSFMVLPFSLSLAPVNSHAFYRRKPPLKVETAASQDLPPVGKVSVMEQSTDKTICDVYDENGDLIDTTVKRIPVRSGTLAIPPESLLVARLTEVSR